MHFTLIASALLAVAAAQHSVNPPMMPAHPSCSAGTLTITVTQTLPQSHLPSAPASRPATGPAPYPTSSAVMSAPPAVGTLMGKPSGTAAPSGTGAYSAPPSQFTGAASSVKVGGVGVVVAGAVAAMFF